MLREERRVLFEEEAEKLSSRLARLQVGDAVELVFYEKRVLCDPLRQGGIGQPQFRLFDNWRKTRVFC